MTIELPDHLVWVNELCGDEWPAGDEDLYFDLADQLRRHEQALHGLDQDADWHARDLIKYNDAEFISAFGRAWRIIRYNQGQAREASILTAEIAWSVGLAVQSAKTAMLGVLALTAARVMRAKMTSSHIPGVAEDAFRAVKAGRIAVAAVTQRLQLFLEVEIAQNAYAKVMETLDQIREIDFGSADAPTADHPPSA